jgi:hypothetical protein
MIRQKQSLVHKVPSGVAILSHVGGVAAIALHTQMCVCIYLANMGRQGILVFYQWKKRNGSRHLVLWSLGTLTGLRDQVWRLVA